MSSPRRDRIPVTFLLARCMWKFPHLHVLFNAVSTVGPKFSITPDYIHLPRIWD
ncbi:hypothetical protein EYZ11_005708 [Aspergillus tanneri]|uniref:Uncharacterized protein n=1 Tax=Aspergillus tanneri TaxID=1220188 RepID=A0A4S3JN77_9EURO|nr:hypothetical protein EYZ11_005708 [Aspergillus tanneri]